MRKVTADLSEKNSSLLAGGYRLRAVSSFTKDFNYLLRSFIRGGRYIRVVVKPRGDDGESDAWFCD